MIAERPGRYVQSRRFGGTVGTVTAQALGWGPGGNPIAIDFWAGGGRYGRRDFRRRAEHHRAGAGAGRAGFSRGHGSGVAPGRWPVRRRGARQPQQHPSRYEPSRNQPCSIRRHRPNQPDRNINKHRHHRALLPLASASSFRRSRNRSMSDFGRLCPIFWSTNSTLPLSVP
jgi:hypothetical protein